MVQTTAAEHRLSGDTVLAGPPPECSLAADGGRVEASWPLVLVVLVVVGLHEVLKALPKLPP